MKRMVSRRSWLVGFLACALSGLGLRLEGQTAGTDRLSRLAQAGRLEGDLRLYASMPTEDQAALIQAFEARYGIKVKSWRSGSEQVLQRAVAETKATRQEFDLVESHVSALEILRQADAFRALEPALGSQKPLSLFPPHRQWAGTRFSIYVCAYNTKLVPAQEVPKTYAELTSSRWRQRVAFEVDDFEWFGTLHTALGEPEARRLFDGIAANGIQVRKGHSLLANLISAGELPLSLTTYSYRISQLMQSGAPIGYQTLSPTLGIPAAIAMAKHTRRPNAAALFIEFMLDEGQRILASRNHLPAIPQGGREFVDRKKLVLLEPGIGIGEQGKMWRTRYEAFQHKAMGSNRDRMR